MPKQPFAPTIAAAADHRGTRPERPEHARVAMDGDALAKTSTAASDGGGLVRQASSAALLLDSLERNGARANPCRFARR